MLNKQSRLEFKTQEEYFDENNLAKPLIKQKEHDYFKDAQQYYNQEKYSVIHRKDDEDTADEEDDDIDDANAVLSPYQRKQ